MYEKTKKSNVTALGWSPRYYDLFAVSFGFCKSIMSLITAYRLSQEGMLHVSSWDALALYKIFLVLHISL